MHCNETVTSWSLPKSTVFEIRDTQAAGRAVFCNQSTQERSLLLTTSAELSPISHVILRPYSREVCAQCFAYDRGREWRIRDAYSNTAFCSDDCQQVWNSRQDGSCRAAIISVEAFTKQELKRNNKEAAEEPTIASAIDPTNREEVETFWKEIADRGGQILAARKSVKPNKPQRAALRKASELTPDIDILAYILSGLITAYIASRTLSSKIESLTPVDLLPSLFDLVPDDNVFINNPMTLSPLRDYAASYLVLMSILPPDFLDLLSADLVINLASRAAHNAFSIRPQGTTDGEQSGEFLGWGVWPEASFFNHSCAPNVRKERRGRQWMFFADTAPGQMVVKGQQLCITYLGGDEKDLDVVERRKRLQEQWGFSCQCERCVREGGHV